MATSNVSVSVSKPYLRALGFSFLALICVALAILALTAILPFSPLSKALTFLVMNRFSPVSLITSYVQGLLHTYFTLDAYVLTPLALVAAGYVFSLKLPKETWNVGRVVNAAWKTGLGLIIGTVVFTWAAESLVQSASNASQDTFLVGVSAAAWIQAAAQAAISTAGYTFGAWIGSGKRKDTSIVAQKSLPSKPRAAKTKHA